MLQYSKPAAIREDEWLLLPTRPARIERRRILVRAVVSAISTLAVFAVLTCTALFAFSADSFGLYSSVPLTAWYVGLGAIMAVLGILFWLGCIRTFDGWHDWKDFTRYGYESLLRLK